MGGYIGSICVGWVLSLSSMVPVTSRVSSIDSVLFHWRDLGWFISFGNYPSPRCFTGFGLNSTAVNRNDLERNVSKRRAISITAWAFVLTEDATKCKQTNLLRLKMQVRKIRLLPKAHALTHLNIVESETQMLLLLGPCEAQMLLLLSSGPRLLRLSSSPALGPCEAILIMDRQLLTAMAAVA